MFRLLTIFLAITSSALAARRCPMERVVSFSNNCVSFTVGQGTGCQWMCDYCAANLGTSNYYFTTPVCSYSETGCVGNPTAGAQYTCCAASQTVEFEIEV